MIELSDLQKDILKMAVEHDGDITNKEIAERLDCSEDWAGETRRKYEHKVNEEEIPDDWQSVREPKSLDSDDEPGAVGPALLLILAIALMWAVENGVI